MELVHAQPKLFDAEHVRDRNLQTEKIAFEVTCYIAFLKRLQNVLNSNINEKYPLPVDSKDIEVCCGDEKSKSSDFTVQCLYDVFSKSSLPTCDSFRQNR